MRLAEPGYRGSLDLILRHFRITNASAIIAFEPMFLSPTVFLPSIAPLMKPLLLIAGFTIALNTIVIAGISLVMGLPGADLVAIHRVGRRAHSKEELGLVALLETARLARADRPQIVVLGTSVAAGAYPPALLQSRLPGFTVTNLAMPGATMTEILQLFDEARWVLPPQLLRKSVLVLGVSYTSFCPDVVRYQCVAASKRAWWKPPGVVTNVRKAADRSPPILGIEHPLRAVLPRWLVLAGKQRLRVWGRLLEVMPFHPGAQLAQAEFWRLQTRSMLRERERHEAVFPRPQPSPGWLSGMSFEEQTKWILAEWGKAGTLLDQSQFVNLSRLLSRATSAGMIVVIVDLPLHSEHRLHAHVLPEFHARLGEAVAAHPDRGLVHLLDLTEALPDCNFLDPVHAKEGNADAWVDLLVDHLRPLLPDSSPPMPE